MSAPDLELDLLRAFVAVAETGSFTAAAEVVGRSQSAVSQKVLRLEEILGRRVFERTSRSLSLTGEGEQLLAGARRMLEFNDALMRQLREPPRIGTLRLGISEDFVPGELPRLLARFSRLHPGVQVDLMTGLSCELLAACDAGRLDAAIAKKDGTAQRGRVIWREPLVWMAAADYQLDVTRPARLVMLRPPCTYRETMIAALDAVRRDWVTVCTASSLMGVQAAVAGGLGVTVLGRSFVQDGMQILEAPEHWPPLPMTEITVIGEDGPAAPLVQPLVAFLTESLGTRRRAMAA
ncbi:LysR family transcriptional regulator [Rhodovastum atsumiense]|uniref:LysR family transcriptional regulator n=1 Tax=Rhodovastum atsumiense TaxID=504468 RepID=A0A5M6IPP5_9PROT|nr:LysR substrate-binding domain-containing protein [Rhodovastum atsumiense]KAA5610253.1 LysR family transcriptional regulator [Rhodovastum atsumiense]CAH2602263.1 LysR family transcriptional regulator [Rhodovastum atsumiense]